MVKINWTRKSLKDIKSIAEYIEQDSFKYAKYVVTNLFNSVIILKSFPYSGRIVPEFLNDNIREIIRGNYRIVYKIIDVENIDILTIHHSKKLDLEIL
jgi:toxin ParE1/3/4